MKRGGLHACLGGARRARRKQSELRSDWQAEACPTKAVRAAFGWKSRRLIPQNASLRCAGQVTDGTDQSGLCVHRHATHGTGTAHHQRGGSTGGGRGRARDPGDRAGGGCDCRGAGTGRPAVLSWRRNQRAPRRAGRLGDPAHFLRAVRYGAGHHGRRGSRTEPCHRDRGGRSGHRRTRSLGTRLHGARRAGRNRGERENALRVGSGGGGNAEVGIAASGRTPYVLGAVAEATRLGAVTVGICCTPDAELSRAVDFAIAPLVGPEIVAGSTRMKAGTAQKLVLNMLSTGTFIRLGYVYGNLMVNVQPEDEKLVDRARRIVARGAGVSPERAIELLAESGMSVRTAILMGKAGIAREEAERRLAASGGRVRQALGEVRQG